MAEHPSANTVTTNVDASMTAGVSDSLIDAIAQAGAGQVSDLAALTRVREFVSHYLKHEDRSDLLNRTPQQLATAMLAHVELGRVRAAGQTKLAVFRTEPATGWGTDNTVIQVVTNDQPYVVDSLLQAVVERGWTVRELIHPQFGVIRDNNGVLKDMAHRSEGRATLRESWVWLEVSPPLGQPATGSIDALREYLLAALNDLALAGQDSSEMYQVLLERAAAARDELTADMLRWLASVGRFTLVGQRRYAIASDGTFTPQPGGLGILRDDERAANRFHALIRPNDTEELVFTNDSELSRVRQASYLDYVGVRLFDAAGRITGEDRYLGLFTTVAYSESVFDVPMLADKAEQIIAAIGYDRDSHGGEVLIGALETFPRDELLHASVAELTPILTQVIALEERRQVRTFIRFGRWGRFMTALVYFTRDRYNTAARTRIIQALKQASGAVNVEWRALVSESMLARLYFTLVAPAGGQLPRIDAQQLQTDIERATRDWGDQFTDLADELSSEQRGIDFSDAYREAFGPQEAIDDLLRLNQLTGAADMSEVMYQPDPPEPGVDFRLKVFRIGAEMVLSRVMPHLSSLGVDVVDERPYELRLRGQDARVYDFGLRMPTGLPSPQAWSPEARQRFTAAFAASYSGRTEADEMNRLVTLTHLDWRQVAVLRSIARYLRQGGIGFSQAYIAATLTKNPQIAVQLVELFETKFDPQPHSFDPGEREQRIAEISASIEEHLGQVSVLDEDRILRRFLMVLGAMVRTNYFQQPGVLQPDDTIVFKLLPRQMSFLPNPRPAFEIFVCSARVEGVHLRFGRVARGGLRWSDRAEDYRTEVLGLVKAQMVKNSVIVPVGAKGGFFPRRLAGLSGPERAAEGKESYRVFIRGLLAVTDNIVDGNVVHPQGVLAWDGDDPYLVVAADKGTASFSDAANEIAQAEGFWLGDAFASGGSHGFDHKGIGITARGAWESTKRHFGELGIGPDDDFTVVGIGDMAGDVFGNGMLLSKHIHLVAAFNHEHIFIDPNPDAATGFAERKRLFEMPGSHWSDYNPELISQGGGVFKRSAKAVPITSALRLALGLPDSTGATLTPDELISAILKAPVDLLWNGGVGTYVKASTESHDQVGDRANNAVRVNGNQVRARCAVEGGNLGWTQAGRVEYARSGGKINTDFIDNSAGVDTSDHEVNIKILLDAQVRTGQLSEAERDELLASVTGEVAELVLSHNISQNQALAAACLNADSHGGVHEELMRYLAADGHLDRELEGLPSSAQMAKRIANGEGLTNPELATVLAWTKIALQDAILETDLPDDPYLAARLTGYFPASIRNRFADQLTGHRLAREIISTVAVNRFVDSQGISAVHRLHEETGARFDDVMRAQLAARNLLDAGWLEVTTGRSQLPETVKTRMRVDIRHLVERATRWLLHEWRGRIDIAEVASDYKTPVKSVLVQLPQLLTTDDQQRWQAELDRLTDDQVPTELAIRMAGWQWAHMALPISRVAARFNRDVAFVARVYFSVSQQVGVRDVLAYSYDLKRSNRWDIVARSGLRDDLYSLAEALSVRVLEQEGNYDDPTAAVQAWYQGRDNAQRVRQTVSQTLSGPVDVARVSVALRVLRDLL